MTLLTRVPASATTSLRRPLVATAVVLGLAGTLVSLLGSWTPSLWGDEAASLLSAERPIPSLFAMILHVDAVHGTYYLGLHLWVQLFGTSPFAIRLPSAIAVGACVAALVVVGSMLGTLRLGVIAAVIAITLPRIIAIGDEARSYAFSAAIAAWLTVLLLEILRHRSVRRGWWIGYAALLAFGIYVFLYLFLIAVAHAAIILCRVDRRQLLRRWAIAVGCAVAAASPLVVTAILEHGQVAYLGTRTEVTFGTLAVTVWFGDNWYAALAWALALAGLVVFALDVRARRQRLRRSPGRLPAPMVVAACWMLLPGILLISSHFLVPDFTARYLAMSAPGAALVMAVSIDRLLGRRVVAVVAALAVVTAVAAPVWVQQRGPYAKNNSDWAELSATMATLARPGDAVVFDESVRPSRLPRLALDTYPAGFAGLKDVTLESPFPENPTWHDYEYTIGQAAALGRFAGLTRVWLVEYAIGSSVDTDGIGELEALGFTRGTTTRNHRSAIIEFTR